MGHALRPVVHSTRVGKDLGWLPAEKTQAPYSIWRTKMFSLKSLSYDADWLFALSVRSCRSATGADDRCYWNRMRLFVGKGIIDGADQPDFLQSLKEQI